MDFFTNLKNCCSPPKRNNSDLDAPYTIITDFNSITEKECGKKDAENEKKYANLLNKADQAAKTIENSGLSMSLEVPRMSCRVMMMELETSVKKVEALMVVWSGSEPGE